MMICKSAKTPSPCAIRSPLILLYSGYYCCPLLPKYIVRSPRFIHVISLQLAYELMLFRLDVSQVAHCLYLAYIIIWNNSQTNWDTRAHVKKWNITLKINDTWCWKNIQVMTHLCWACCFLNINRLFFSTFDDYCVTPHICFRLLAFRKALLCSCSLNEN